MKSTGLVFLLMMILCIIGSCILPACAAEYSFHSAEIGTSAAQDAWETLMENLPENVQMELRDFSMEDLTSTADILKEKSDVRYWLKQLLHYSFPLLIPNQKTKKLISMLPYTQLIQLIKSTTHQLH